MYVTGICVTFVILIYLALKHGKQIRKSEDISMSGYCVFAPIVAAIASFIWPIVIVVLGFYYAIQRLEGK